MKKILLITSFLFLLSCTEQMQEQSQITNSYTVERPNFNTVPWATIDLIDGIGEVKLGKLKLEFEKGQFKNGKDFEERMKAKDILSEDILSPEMIGKIGEKFDFEEVSE